MTSSICPRSLLVSVGIALPAFFSAAALAEDSVPWTAPSAYQDYQAPPRGGAYPPAANGAPAQGPQVSANGYSGGDSYGRGGYSANDSYSQSNGGNGGGNGEASSGNRGGYSANDAYSSGNGGYSGNGDAGRYSRNDSFSDPGQPADGGRGGYGEPYAPPPESGAPYRDGPPPQRDGRSYDQNEIIATGHGFFGAISQGLASAVEYAFKSEGRPNGYILGEDAGGAFMVGLRYGEGRLYTKDAGDYKVFWQGPSLGYDMGGEGSKAMVLVYNLHDPSEIYNRFGGVQGAAYLVGGVSVQFQTYGDVKLAVIRSGVGLRLGANIGYLKYTRAPTWNPL